MTTTRLSAKIEWQKTVHLAFVATVIFYLVCLVSEQFIPGFVSFYFPLHWVLWVVVIFALLDGILHWGVFKNRMKKF
ncbi:MAG: hypothetical protein A3F54_05260 [Candidatus Kerfeldbacteria bacterium RIFCSPHIGHO2_12_FULL_48_17]|uniref:2TM domain-containing protein n=1 Tax=Candidatus Kerfeldbacteria bacterium RIFCSPHIGHO2_12_FULL_48_17 TaxID=1798542 RepID=A0A1G2B683_9BACT|nr:MAG: hypothetical protein A3F54_05260 [Candidatus Kerfeldbacteria bacterium RIFCSPHIGHO2_12_FULL_48_17]